MANLKTNKTTLYYVDLGSKTNMIEENKERARITRDTAPDNNTIMAYQYPKNYKVDRLVWVGMIVNDDLTTEYYVTFCHRCLSWQHTRVYSLNKDEYEYMIDILQDKYGRGDMSVFEASSTMHFMSTHLQFELSQLTTIGE